MEKSGTSKSEPRALGRTPSKPKFTSKIEYEEYLQRGALLPLPCGPRLRPAGNPGFRRRPFIRERDVSEAVRLVHRVEIAII
jgi:hypothetical protein